MDAIVDPNSGLASEAALRDTYVAQLEAFMAETRVLTAERVSLGDTKPSGCSLRGKLQNVER
jgi:hypothetical protein